MLRFVLALSIAAISASAFGQHGTAGPGLYTFNYHGDTWTGVISALDVKSRTITLTYETKKKRETFDAVLQDPLRIEVLDSDRRIKLDDFKVGDRVFAYYIAKGQKRPAVDKNGKKMEIVADSNIIFRIDLLPPKRGK